MKPVQKSVFMSAEQIENALREIAAGIAQRHKPLDDVVLVGIRTRGAYLSDRLIGILKETTDVQVPAGILDITLYRDDLTLIAPNPVVRKTVIPFDITGKKIILVDDVFYTGRTIRAALDEIIDFGRPSIIEVAVLIDRGSHELPIHADYTGASVEVDKDSIVEVRLGDVDGVEEVAILGKS